MELLETVKSYIIDNYLFGDESGLDNDTSFLESGIIDSTGMLELINFLEEQFNITITDEEVLPENLDSLDKVASFLEKKTGMQK